MYDYQFLVYSSTPKVLPCGPEPGRYLTDDKWPLHLTLMCLFSKKEAITGMREALTPFSMKLFTPNVGHCFGKAAFQSTRVARTATHSPLVLLSVTERILSSILMR